jgi:hypothetical protein
VERVCCGRIEKKKLQAASNVYLMVKLKSAATNLRRMFLNAFCFVSSFGRCELINSLKGNLIFNKKAERCKRAKLGHKTRQSPKQVFSNEGQSNEYIIIVLA